MHTVTCPNCSKVLKVPQAVSQARVHCTGCDAVFVASSTPVEPPLATADTLAASLARSPEAGRSSKARLYRGRQKTPASVSPTALVVAGAGVVGVVILAIVCVYVASKGSDDKGPDDQRTSTQPSGDKQPGGAGRTGGDPDKTGRPDKGTGSGVTTGGGGGTSGRPPKTGGNQPQNDVLIRVNHKRRSDDYGNVTFYGEVRNAHKYAVRQVALKFVIAGGAADGKDAVAGAVCNHIPAMGAVGFSVKLGQLAEGVTPTITATSIPEPEGIVCWRVDVSEVRLDAETVKGAVIINGRVKNPTETPVTNVEIHCDFFWRTGQYHSTVVGKLTKAMRIGPGKSEAYRVTLANVLAPSSISDQTIMRLVGRTVR